MAARALTWCDSYAPLVLKVLWHTPEGGTRLKRHVWQIPLLATVFLGTAAFYQGLVTRTYTLTTSKWIRGASLRFVVVSDLHSILFGREQQKLLRVAEQQKPDFLLLPGDIVDDHHPSGAAAAFLRGASSLAPSYYTPGNHEYRTRRMRQIIHLVERNGVIPLLDTYRQLLTPAGPILIAGCEDPEKQRFTPGYHQAKTAKEVFREIRQTDSFSVLLAHRPERHRLYRDLGFDLAVSGHAHGGQARIPPLINGIYSPDQGLFPHYAGGCYVSGGFRHVVSRGVAVFPGVPRIFNPPEVTVIHVRGIASVAKPDIEL